MYGEKNGIVAVEETCIILCLQLLKVGQKSN